jgi:hypothetical protein
LVKPVDTADLIDAVEKAEKSIYPNRSQINSLQKQFRGEPLTKIAVPASSRCNVY